MQDVTLTIDGMSCGHCVRAVEEALAGALAGTPGAAVEQVQVGAARVRLPDGADAASVDALVAAVEEAGFVARPAPAGSVPPASGADGPIVALGRRAPGGAA